MSPPPDRLDGIENLLDAGQPAAAKRVVQTLLQQDPDDARLLYLLARCQLATGEPEAALRAARTAMAGMPASCLPCAYAALALLRLGRPAEAQEAATEGVRREPDRGWSHYILAKVTAEDDPELSYRAALRAVELDPEDADSHFFVGLAAARTGRRSTAVQAYRKTLELNPEDAIARHNLAMGDLDRGDPLTALRGLTAAVAGDPHHDLLREHVDLPVSRGLLVCLAITGLVSLLSLLPNFPRLVGTVVVVLGAAGLALALRLRLSTAARRIVWSYPRRHPVWIWMPAAAAALQPLGYLASWWSPTLARACWGLAALLALVVLVVVGIVVRRASGSRQPR